MSASKELKILSVRLPEKEVRHLKSVAASRGLSMQEAVHQALKAWGMQRPALPAESLDTLRGSLAGVDFETLMRREREAELARDRRWS